MNKEIATRKLLHPLTKIQRKELAEFCYAVKQVIEGKVNRAPWFCDRVGLCSNKQHFGGKHLWLYSQFKEEYPFGYTTQNLYKDPVRLAFINYWAQKHLDYTAKKP